MTEDEDYAPLPPAHLSSQSQSQSQSQYLSSETESEESDPRLTCLPPPTARPQLKPRADQVLKGPLILDSKTRVCVPASINRFLRSYQRDGVRFFWERWREGRGGVLGA